MCCQVHGRCWSQGSETLGLAQWVLYKAVLGTQVGHRSWDTLEGKTKDNNTKHESTSKRSVL